MGKAWWQEGEVVGHIVATIRKQRRDRKWGCGSGRPAPSSPLVTGSSHF